MLHTSMQAKPINLISKTKKIVQSQIVRIKSWNNAQKLHINNF